MADFLDRDAIVFYGRYRCLEGLVWMGLHLDEAFDGSRAVLAFLTFNDDNDNMRSRRQMYRQSIPTCDLV